MSYTNGLDNPELYFQVKLYTGNNSSQSITLDGDEDMQPDWTWIKSRSGSSRDHLLFDAIRTPTKFLKSNSNSAEATASDTLTAFATDGFNVGANGGVNDNGETYASWNWKAGGSTSSNSDGDITSTVSVNTTAGFSIVSYTGNETTLQTVGHGLGVIPKWIIVKNRSTAGAWMIYHESLGVSSGTIQRFIQLDNTNAQNNGGSGDFPTAPTNSVFGIGNFQTMNKSGDSIIAYCFAEKKSYSKFGSYTGNGSTDGTFVYTGFRPAFTIFKRSSGTGGWLIHDNKRSESGGGNPLRKYLVAQTSGAEGTDDFFTIDHLSNGFKLRATDGESNASGSTYIYMSFAENPFVTSTGIPTTAR
jgi:hypothetical protein